MSSMLGADLSPVKFEIDEVASSAAKLQKPSPDLLSQSASITNPEIVEKLRVLDISVSEGSF